MDTSANKSRIFFQSLVIATVAEFLGLFYWVNLVDKGNIMAGLAIIIIGLLAERISVYMLIHAVWGQNPPHKNLVLNLIIAGFGESLAWLLWLFLADKEWGLLLSSVFLGVLILLEHSIQIGFFMQQNYFKHILNPTTIVFSALEAIVAYYWLYLVRSERELWGAVVLFVGLTIEHIIQGSVIGTEPPRQVQNT